jgi:hypothetical protein
MSSIAKIHTLRPVPPRPWWRRRRVFVPVAGLVLVVLLALGANFAAGAYIEHKTADAFQDATGTPDTPSVHVKGFPVLTQMARGKLKQVDIDARDIPAGDDSLVPISALDVRLSGLERSGDADSAHADKASATAFISYGDLSKALGITIGPSATSGRIEASISVPVLGDFQITVKPAIAGHNTIAFTDVQVDSNLPSSVSDTLTKALERTIPLQNVPGGLTLTRFSTGTDGLTAVLSGSDVTFTQAGKQSDQSDQST